jgi:anaerobic ribonucleoside-triphosphate reductase activating protein
MTTIPTNFYPNVFPALNVAEIDVVEGAAGPGWRLVVWLQGCLKRCPECANQLFLQEIGNRILFPKQLLDLLDTTGELNGITLSGGEPVLQAAALVPMIEKVHERRLTVVCYSGYKLEELIDCCADPAMAKFLNGIDLLIDGEYIKDLPRTEVYCSSTNQRIHFLSSRISRNSCEQSAETVFDVGSGRVVATGTLPTAIRNSIFEKMSSLGIRFGPLS